MNYIETKPLLEGEYKELFEKIEDYALTVACLDGEPLNERMMELSDLFLTAQSKGKPAEKIVGKDINAFCESYFGELTLKERASVVTKDVWMFMSFVSIFTLLDLLLGESEFVFTNPTVYLVLMAGSLLERLILPPVMKAIYVRRMRHSKLLFLGVSLVYVVLVICAALFISSRYTLPVPNIVVCIIAACYIVGYGAYDIIKRLRKNGTIKNPAEKQAKNDVREKMLLNNWQQVLSRKNEKRARKGLPPISEAEYSQKLQRSVKINKLWNIFLTVILTAFIICCVIIEWIVNSPLDAVIYGLLLIAVEAPLVWLFYSSNKRERNLLEKCKALNLTVFEYSRQGDRLAHSV